MAKAKLAGRALALAHQQAPRHPVHVEGQVRLRIRRLMGRFRDYLLDVVGRAMDRVLGLDVAVARARMFGLQQMRSRAFLAPIIAGARRMGSLLREKLAKLTRSPSAKSAPLEGVVAAHVEAVKRTVEHAVANSCDKASGIVADWLVVAPADQREQALTEVRARVDGATGTAQFGRAFFELNQHIQAVAGVDEYVWLTKRDYRVRDPEGVNIGHHLEHEGQICRWDTPPLPAAKSTSGEPCHAGEDVGCRCIAMPWSRKSQSGAQS